VARERGDGADVVEVRVREQDRLGGQPEVVERRDQARGLVAGVDHERAVAPVGVHDPAVLLERPDGEAAGGHPPCCCLRRCARW
jgi:hypothetical protein